jgi:hypothetical protein
LHDYKTIAKVAGLPDDLNNDDLMSAVRTWIELQKNWLLVIDNADSLENFSQQYATSQNVISPNLYSFIPQGTTGAVLWTSRDRKIVGGLVGPTEGINVDRMPMKESKELLAGLSNRDIAKEDPVALE